MPEREECGKKARGAPESPVEEGCDELEHSLVARKGSPAAHAKASSRHRYPGAPVSVAWSSRSAVMVGGPRCTFLMFEFVFLGSFSSFACCLFTRLHN